MASMKSMSEAARLEGRRISRTPGLWLSLVFLALFSALSIAAGLYHVEQWKAEGQALEIRRAEAKESLVQLYESGKTSPEGKPWMNVTLPVWADRLMGNSVFMTPSPLAFTAVGVSDVQGTHGSLTRTTDGRSTMGQALIRSPDQLRLGVMDYAFVVIYLSPLLLILLGDGIGVNEDTKGLTTLVKLRGSLGAWLAGRLVTSWALVLIALTLPLVIGAWRSGALLADPTGVLGMWGLSALWLLFWTTLLGAILAGGTPQGRVAVIGLCLWVLFVPILSGAVSLLLHQQSPAAFDPTIINGMRADSNKIYKQELEEILPKFYSAYPELKPLIEADESLQATHKWRLYDVVVTEKLRGVSQDLDAAINERNQLAQSTVWFSPATAMSLAFAELSCTGEGAFLSFRSHLNEQGEARLDWVIQKSFKGEPVGEEAVWAERDRITPTWSPQRQWPQTSALAMGIFTLLAFLSAQRRLSRP